MNRTMKHGVMAAVLLGGAALISAPASANSVHDEGYFGEATPPLGRGPITRDAARGVSGPFMSVGPILYGPRYYYGPGYEYSPYDYGPMVTFARGFAMGIY